MDLQTTYQNYQRLMQLDNEKERIELERDWAGYPKRFKAVARIIVVVSAIIIGIFDANSSSPIYDLLNIALVLVVIYLPFNVLLIISCKVVQLIARHGAKYKHLFTMMDGKLSAISLEQNEIYQKVAKSEVPLKYRNYNVLKVLIQMINDRRADSMKEAINLYENELRANRIEQCAIETAKAAEESAKAANITAQQVEGLRKDHWWRFLIK